MANNLFVGGIPYETTQDELKSLFSTCGKVAGVKLIMDRDTGRSKGFGFVEMSTEAEAQAALKKLNGAALGDRKLFISEAKPQEKRFEGFAPKPGFVERRSGVKDRRRSQAPAPAAGEKKPWDKKPGAAGGEKKPWEKKPWDKKPGSFAGEKKPWEKKPWDKKPGAAGGAKKPWEKKPWDKKPGGFAGKKSFDKKPGGFGGGKKWGGKRGG